MCVVVGNIGSDSGCGAACLSLGLVGLEVRAGWWRLRRGLRGRGGRRGGLVVEAVWAVAWAGVAGRIEVAVAGIVVAIVHWVVGFGRVVEGCRRVALVVGSGIC